jgi:hypothetical protein
MSLPVLLPQHREVDSRPAHLSDPRRPIWLGSPSKALLHSGSGEQALFQNRVADLGAEWPGQAGVVSVNEVEIRGGVGAAIGQAA